jgi:uncharacterized protein (TIGR02453 family)
MTSVPASTLDFLRTLARNNTREWFHENKKPYEKVKSAHEALIGALIERIGQFENLANVEPKDCNYRIARDIRFTNDKTPYKTWLSASFAEGGRKANRMDYYLHIQPGDASFLGGGMYAPSAGELAKFRQEIDYNVAELRRIIEAPEFVHWFGTGEGVRLKTAPKGYPKDHPDIDLLRLTQLFFLHRFTDAEVQAPDFAERVTEACQVLKPYLDFLNFTFLEEREAENTF